MYCPKCEETFEDGIETCPKCGGNLDNEMPEQAVIYASANHSNHTKKVIGVAIVCLCVICVYFVVNGIIKANLRKAFIDEWMTVDDGVLCILNISDDKIEYRIDTVYWGEKTLAVFDWDVVSSDKIKVKYPNDDEYSTFMASLSDDQLVLTISPGLTSRDELELWFRVQED